MLNTPEEIKEQVKNPIGFITLRHDDVLTFEPHPGVTRITKDQLIADTEIFRGWTQRKKMPFLSDNRKLRSMSAEEREFAQKNLEIFASRFALVVDNKNGLSRFLTNLMITIGKPSVPTKIFSDFESAWAWIREDSQFKSESKTA